MDNCASNDIEAVVVSEHDPDDGLALHRHEASYVAIVLEGGYVELSADGRWNCEEGDVIVHPSFHLHANRFCKRRTRVLNLSGSAVDALAGIGSACAVYRSASVDDVIRSPVDVAGLVSLVSSSAPVRPHHGSEWLGALAEDLAGDEEVSVNAAARLREVTPEHVSRVFRANFGMPPSRFRAERRLQKALGMLRDRARSIADVAHSAGFYDQAHLARWLRVETGMTARQLRARCV